jgi:tRNA threonylcarbamoyladenosine biosynthesis protein TsaB
VLILAVDTCLAACQAALFEDGRTIASVSEPMARGHQERLAPMVEALMREAGLSMNAVDRVAVTVGPGSFTGLRVGLAFAKGLALALDRPIIGVGTLEALAASVDDPGLIVAIVDARRDQAYWQAFRNSEPLSPPQAWTVTDIVDWAVEHGPPGVLVGPGSGLLASRFAAASAAPIVAPDPVAVARLAAVRQPARPQPLYLRTPDAKLPGGVDPAP